MTFNTYDQKIERVWIRNKFARVGNDIHANHS